MKNNKMLMIIGAGGHAKVCIDIAEKMKCWKSIELLDDNSKLETLFDKDIIGKVQNASNYKDTHEFIVAIGDNETRKNIYNSLIKLNAKIATLIDPSSEISKYSVILSGTVIMPNCTVNADAKINNNCIINTGCVVEHDCNVGSHVHLSPGCVIAGNVTLQDNVWIGSNSVVKQNTSIVSNVTIGACSFVNKNITKPGIYYGVI